MVVGTSKLSQIDKEKTGTPEGARRERARIINATPWGVNRKTRIPSKERTRMNSPVYATASNPEIRCFNVYGVVKLIKQLPLVKRKLP